MLNKTSHTKLNIKMGYTKIHNRIFLLNLSPVSALVFFYYVSCTEEFNPSIRHTAKTLNISPSTVVSSNKELELAGMIKKIEQGYISLTKGDLTGGKVTKYSLCHPDNWKPLQMKKRVRLY
jgi:predicted transcriptional regulator